MIKRKEIIQAIDSAEKSFLWCWNVLCFLRGRNKTNVSIKDILEFQNILATSIFDIETIRSRVIQEKKCLIGRKSSLNLNWFVKRMACLERYNSFLNQTLTVAKSIGDAFVWFFYQNDLPVLVQHLSKQKIFHMPHGIGGRGELEFIRKNKVINGYFVIYHSITTILRHGDLSLIDMKSHRLVGMGEIKSGNIEENHIRVTASFLIPEDKLSLTKPDNIQGNTGPGAASKLSELIYSKQACRLQKQIKGIHEALKASSIKSEMELKYENCNSHMPDINKLYIDMGDRDIAFFLANSSLLLVANRINPRRLFCRISSKIDYGNALKNTNLSEMVMGIIDKGNKDLNSIIISNILYHGKNHEPDLLYGMAPLFWESIDIDILKKIYFKQIMIYTIFNPAHILHRLSNNGFSVKCEHAKRKYDVRMKLSDNRVLEFCSIEYFLQLMMHYLYREDFVYKMIEDLAIEAKNKPGAGRIDLTIYHHFIYKNIAPDIVDT